MTDPQKIDNINEGLGVITKSQDEILTSSLMRTSGANALMFAPILLFNQGLFATFNRFELVAILFITSLTCIANFHVIFKTMELIRTVGGERQNVRLKAAKWLLIGNLLYGISGLLISVAPVLIPSFATSTLLGLGATISLVVTGVITRDWIKSKGDSKCS